jgi:hypothetical protein
VLGLKEIIRLRGGFDTVFTNEKLTALLIRFVTRRPNHVSISLLSATASIYPVAAIST